MNWFDFFSLFYEKFHFGAKKTFKKIYQLGEFQKMDVILDLGGGTGRIAKFFVNKVRKIIVLDSSRDMIKRCKKHNGLSCFFGQAEKIPFPNNYFDKVIIIDAFHHFKNQEKTCEEIKRVLKTNGIVLIEEFNPKIFFGKIIARIESLLMMKSFFHSPDSLDKLLKKYSFTTRIINENKTVYYLIAKKL